MGTVGTTTATTPLQLAANTLVDRNPLNGHLYALHRSSTANTFEIRRSTDGGANWTLHTSLVRTAVQEIGSIFIANDDHLYWTYRTDESSQDRIYVRRLRLADAVWGAEILTGTPGNGGVAGAVHTGMDLQVVGGAGARYNGQQGAWVAVAAGTVLGGMRGITLYGVFYPLTGQEGFSNTSVYVGNRQWLVESGTGAITPSVDIEHDGTGKVSAVPNLWVTWGRAKAHLVKLAWNGKWNGTTSWVDLSTTLSPLQDPVAGRWDGARFVVVVPDPTTTDRVKVFERNRANSATVTRQSPAHPTGVVRTCSFSYNHLTKDLRVYATGTSTPDLYYNDYIRATATWGTWTAVTATDVMGTPPSQFSVRRGSTGNAKHDLVIAHPGTPNTVSSYHQGLAYAPNTPTWDTAAIGYTDGQPADINGPLRLDWVFSDPDPADTQSAWAISRQIGAGTVAYLRDSDSTWQATEQKNTGGTSARTLAPFWAADSDAAHTYKVKVWDASDTASGYSAGLVLVPSEMDIPTITAPTLAQVLTADTVTTSWTVAEQTARRVRLRQLYLGDTFTNAETNTWGPPDVGPTPTVSGGVVGDYSCASGFARHSMGSVNVARETLWAVGVTNLDVTLGPMTVPTAPTGARAETWIRARVVDANNYVDCRMYRNTNGTVTVSLRQVVGGVETASSFPVSDGVFAASTIMMRFRVHDEFLLVRVWDVVAMQPTLWLLDFQTSHLASGSVTVRSLLASGNTNTLPYLMQYGAITVNSVDTAYDSSLQTTGELSQIAAYRLPDNSAWSVGVQTANLERLLSTEQFQYFTVDFVEPATPTVAMAPIPGLGVMRVTITNPTPGGGQPALADQDLWRRPVGDTSDGVRVATALASGATVDDFGPASGVNYEWRVLARGVNGASIYGAWTS